MRLSLLLSAAALGLVACSPAPATDSPADDVPEAVASTPGTDGPAGSGAAVAPAAAAPQDPPPVREGIPADPDRPVGGPVAEMPPGGLTLAAFQDRQLDRFRRADANKDGVVDAAEMDGMGRGGRRMTRADSDGDGRVTEAEARAAAAAMFDRLDADGDGRVTEDERPQR